MDSQQCRPQMEHYQYEENAGGGAFGSQTKWAQALQDLTIEKQSLFENRCYYFVVRVSVCRKSTNPRKLRRRVA